MVSTGADMLPLDVSIHSRLLLFTLAVTICTAILFGTLPALRATRLELTDVLKDGRSPGSGAAKTPLAKSLIILQVAFSLVLLVGTCLFVCSLINLNHVDTGFNRHNALVLNLDPSSIGYKDTEPRLAALYQQIEQRVAAVSFAFLTFDQGSWHGNITVPGIDPSQSTNVPHDVVGNGYFKAMGIPLLAGRAFGPQDTATSQKVTVISERFAKLYFPNSNPIGRTYHLGGPETSWQMQIIGIAKDVKFQSLDEKAIPLDYIDDAQRPQYLQDLVVRYDGPATAVSTAVQNAIHSISPNLPITRVSSLEEQVSDSITQQRTVAQLSAFFGLLAVFLSCIGIYGLMSYMVSRRTNEIGVRIALGASRASVSWMVMREILILVGLGVAIGVPVTLACSRLVANMLYGIRPTDAASVTGSVLALLLVGLLSGWLPARRASHVNPMVALRYE